MAAPRSAAAELFVADLKRGKPRFSLRSLVLLVLLAGAVCGLCFPTEYPEAGASRPLFLCLTLALSGALYLSFRRDVTALNAHWLGVGFPDRPRPLFLLLGGAPLALTVLVVAVGMCVALAVGNDGPLLWAAACGLLIPHGLAVALPFLYLGLPLADRRSLRWRVFATWAVLACAYGLFAWGAWVISCMPRCQGGHGLGGLEELARWFMLCILVGAFGTILCGIVCLPFLRRAREILRTRYPRVVFVPVKAGKG